MRVSLHTFHILGWLRSLQGWLCGWLWMFCVCVRVLQTLTTFNQKHSKTTELASFAWCKELFHLVPHGVPWCPDLNRGLRAPAAPPHNAPRILELQMPWQSRCSPGSDVQPHADPGAPPSLHSLWHKHSCRRSPCHKSFRKRRWYLLVFCCHPPNKIISLWGSSPSSQIITAENTNNIQTSPQQK